MKFTIDRQENYNVLQFDEEKLDSTFSPELKSEFLTMQSQGIKNVIVDLKNAKYIDSSGLSSLLVGNRIFTENGGSFILCNISDHAKKLISISQLDKVLNILSSVEEGVDLIFLNDLERGLKKESE